MQELLGSAYQITVYPNTVYQNDFEQAKSGVFFDLWLTKFMDKNKSFTKTSESKILVQNELYAMYKDLYTAKNYKEYKKCQLKIMNFKARTALMGFGFPKDSPLLPLFNNKIQSMMENGEIQRIIEKHRAEEPDCNNQRGKPLGFENIALLFILLLCGIFSSILVYVSEIVLRRKAAVESTVNYF